jgi:hypothetical protein
MFGFYRDYFENARFDLTTVGLTAIVPVLRMVATDIAGAHSRVSWKNPAQPAFVQPDQNPGENEPIVK